MVNASYAIIGGLLFAAGIILVYFVLSRLFNFRIAPQAMSLVETALFSITPQQLSQNVAFGKKGEDYLQKRFESKHLYVKNIGRETGGLGDLNVSTHKSRLNTIENGRLAGKEWVVEVKTVQEWESGGKVRRRGRAQISREAHQNLLIHANRKGATPVYLINFIPENAIRKSSNGSGWSKWGNVYVDTGQIETYRIGSNEVSAKIEKGKGKNVLISYKELRYPEIKNQINQDYKTGKINKIKRDQKLSKLDSQVVKSERFNPKNI